MHLIITIIKDPYIVYIYIDIVHLSTLSTTFNTFKLLCNGPLARRRTHFVYIEQSTLIYVNIY